jgi:putative protein kinase ArgK-like GTPase of G3E family
MPLPPTDPATGRSDPRATTAWPSATRSEAAGPERIRAKYLMVGGFLGAGKTTAISRFGRYLTELGLRVGLITNDQGNDLAPPRN